MVLTIITLQKLVIEGLSNISCLILLTRRHDRIALAKICVSSHPHAYELIHMRYVVVMFYAQSAGEDQRANVSNMSKQGGFSIEQSS